MIDYINPWSIDPRSIDRAINELKSGNLICLPIDTNWVVCADPFNKKAVEKLYKFKHEDPHHHFSLFCSSISMASKVAFISDAHFRLIKRSELAHYTYIFKAQKEITKYLTASKTDHEVGIRFPQMIWAKKLIENFESPLIGAHMNKTEDQIMYGQLIEDNYNHEISLIWEPGEFDFFPSTTIIKFIEDHFEILRVGSGDIKLFS